MGIFLFPLSYQPVVERRRQLLEIQPDIERAVGWYCDVKMELMKARKDMVSFRFEMLLQSDLDDYHDY